MNGSTDVRVTPLLDGIRFPEGLRWHAGALWFSDVSGRAVIRMRTDGRADVVAQFDDDEPSGLGFLPDGTPLVALMWQRRIVRINADGGTSLHADLRHLPGGWLNDMVVDGQGNAYVDHADPAAQIVSPFRRDHDRFDPDGEGIAKVSPDGEVTVVARGLHGPNGLVITQDRTTLIVAESPLHRLTAFTVAGDGSLGDRRTFADLGEVRPDGLAVDADNGVWVASHQIGPNGGGFVRFTEGSVATTTVPAHIGWGVSCALGGPDRRTLYMSSIVAESAAALREEGKCQGYIAATPVAIPGAGWP